MDEILEKASIFCSIASFLISIVLWIRTSEIKKDLLARNRLPQILKSFDRELTGLLNALSLADSEDQGAELRKARGHLTKLHSLAISMGPYLPKKGRKIIRAKVALFYTARWFRKDRAILMSAIDMETAWTISEELNFISQFVRQKVLDLKVV